MRDFATVSLISFVIGSLGVVSVLLYFILTRRTVRVTEENGGDGGQRTLHLINEHPHPVMIVAVGPVLADGTVDPDFDPLGMLPRKRIEARQTLALPVPPLLAVYGTYQATLGGRLGWWVRLESGQTYYTHRWVTRWIWNVQTRVNPKTVSQHAEKRRLMRKDWEENYERRQ